MRSVGQQHETIMVNFFREWRSNRAATAFRQAAISTQASDSDLGAYYRRMKARLGGPKAVTVTAHKLARLYYRLVKHGEEYVEAGARVYEEKHRERVIRSLQKRARGRGFELLATASGTFGAPH